VRQVLFRKNTTCGRRFMVWGPLKATFIHFKISLMWLFGSSAESIQHVYDSLYTDSIR
jgi:hypothetical protein